MNIMLAQFGKVEFEDLAKAITYLDDEFIGIGGITSIINFIPEEDEKRKIKSYVDSGNDVANLGKAERFILAIQDVPNLRQRLLAMQAKLTYFDAADHLEEDIDLIIKATKETKNSAKFRSLLAIILKLGNKLNEGTAKESAAGFKMSGLVKLTETKTNRGETLLDYVVTSMIENMKEMLEVVDDFPHVNGASRKSFGTLKAAMTKLQGMAKITDGALNKIQQEDESEDYIGMQGLLDFFTEAEERLTAIQEKYKEMELGFRALCKYLGEEGETAEPQQLFGTLTHFVGSLRSAKTKVEDKIERRERAKKREHERQKRVSMKSPLASSNRPTAVASGGSTPAATTVASPLAGPPSTPQSGKVKRGKKREKK